MALHRRWGIVDKLSDKQMRVKIINKVGGWCVEGVWGMGGK